MARVRVHNFTISLDGYGAGPDQTEGDPMGVGGQRLHPWAMETLTYRKMMGIEGGSTGLDDEFAARGDEGIGATIMGRNMFGPIRGPWDGSDWSGWWGDEPPYHHDVFVHTHYARPSLTMQGGTTFHFVDDPIEDVLARALDAADGADVRIGGGVATVQQYLRARLIDEMHVVIAPILLGGGERLFDGLGADAMGYECLELVSTDAVVHARFAKGGT